jgi:RimJ/RimL family protein N-acetyltransferase
MTTININKIKLYWKEHGTLNLLIKKVLPFLFSYVPLNYYCISHVPENKIQAKCPLEIRKGSLDDIELIIDFFGGEDKKIIYEQTKYLLDTGGEIFLAFSDGELAHVGRLRHYPGVLEVHSLERDPRIKLNKDEVYIGHCETATAFKGKNILPVVLQHIIKYAFENGKKRCFGSSNPSYKASIKGQEKAGFSFAGKIRKFRIFGKLYNDVWSSSEMDL